MADDESRIFRWEKLPTDPEDRPLVTLGDLTLRIPYPDLVQNSVYTRGQRSSIRQTGVTEPIVVNANSGEVVDGIARAYFAHELGLSRMEVPVEWRRLSPSKTLIEAVKNHTFPTFILYPELRRKYLRKIIRAKGWDDPYEHLGELMTYLRVGTDQIRKDLQLLKGQQGGAKLSRTRALLERHQRWRAR